MKCLECFDSLQRRLDGETDALSTEVEEHLARCPSCRREYAAADLLLKGLKGLSRPECPPDFAQRLAGLVMQEMAEPAAQDLAAQDLALQDLATQERAVPLPRQPQVRRPRVRARLAIGFALAAAVLIAAGYVFLREPGGATVAETPKGTESPVAQKAPAPLPKTQIIVIDHNPDDNAAKVDPIELEAAAASIRQTGQGMAEGLQPLGKTARRALDFFFRELPVIADRKQ